MPLDFGGFHIFCGSQNLRPDICEAQQKFGGARLEPREAPAPVRLLNLGGGLGIPYFPGKSRSTWRQSASTCPGWPMRRRARRKQTWSSSSVATWSARPASTSAASSTARSRAVRCSSSPTAACTITSRRPELRTGAAQELPGGDGADGRRPPDGIGVRRRPALHAARPARGPRRSPPACGPGDLIVVAQSGAYGYSASPHLFLGHPPPVEVLV